MILFVFEGKREERLFAPLKRLFWGEETTVIAVYECNIDALYHEMQAIGDYVDIVALLRAKYEGKPDNPFMNVSRSDEFSEIYLVFDYDFHDVSRSAETLNEQLRYLLDYFNEETDHGKLYVNYPMVEALVYTKQLPDEEFVNYTVSREECRCFKQLAHDFSFYPNYDFILRGAVNDIRHKWGLLKKQNVDKARVMCKGDITQPKILESQVNDYECRDGCQVAVLSGIALLLYDWLGY